MSEMPQWMKDYHFPLSTGTAIECGRLYRQLGYSIDEAHKDFRRRRNDGEDITGIIQVLKKQLALQLSSKMEG